MPSPPHPPQALDEAVSRYDTPQYGNSEAERESEGDGEGAGRKTNEQHERNVRTVIYVGSRHARYECDREPCVNLHVREVGVEPCGNL